VKEATAVKGNVIVYGHVTGDAAAVMGNIYVRPGGRIDGDASTVMGKIIQDPGSKIGGSIDSVGFSIPPSWLRSNHNWNWWFWNDEPFGLTFLLIFRAGMIVFYALLVVLIVALFPTRMAMIAQCTLNRPGWAFLYGLIGLMAIVPLAVALAITCVGIPFIAVELILTLLIWIAGAAGLKLAVGQKIGEGMERPFRSMILAAVVGSLLVDFVRLIPFIGGLVALVLHTFGFGAVLITGFGTDPDWFHRRFSRTTQVPPNPPSTIGG